MFQSLWKGVASKVDSFRTLPRLVGETGGKDFVLAHASANASEVAIALIRGAFGYQGQKCSAASRAYVPKSLWGAVEQELRDRLAQLKVGDVADFSTFMGAVIAQASHQKLSRVLSAAKEDGAVKVVSGGKTWSDPGYFVEPTVLQVSDPKHALMTEELFGPILSVFVYEDNKWDETLELIDATSPYALTGSIFCTDRFALHQAEAALVNAAGNLYLNDKPTGAMIGQQPFGGGRASGTNDKAGSYLNLLRWVSPRTVKETYLPTRDWQFGAKACSAASLRESHWRAALKQPLTVGFSRRGAGSRSNGVGCHHASPERPLRRRLKPAALTLLAPACLSPGQGFVPVEESPGSVRRMIG